MLARAVPVARSLRVSAPAAWTQVCWMSKGKKGAAGGGGGGGPASSTPPDPIDETVGAPRKRDHVPVNYLKGQQNPALQADTEYPEWVFNLAATQPSVAEMELNGVSTYTDEQIKRYMNLKAKSAIRSTNELLKK
mmetsp:Transcript_21861/g.70390  ORF Transcript_21861/g.70390 Transcript_21861/m.70390 type:complete len:135 (+) Transcript_21861:1-405(+)